MDIYILNCPFVFNFSVPTPSLFTLRHYTIVRFLVVREAFLSLSKRKVCSGRRSSPDTAGLLSEWPVWRKKTYEGGRSPWVELRLGNLLPLSSDFPISALAVSVALIPHLPTVLFPIQSSSLSLRRTNWTTFLFGLESSLPKSSLSLPTLQKQYPLYLSTISKLLSCSLHDLGHEHPHCILVWPHLLLSPSFPSSLSVLRACSLQLSALSSWALQRSWYTLQD